MITDRIQNLNRFDLQFTKFAARKCTPFKLLLYENLQ